MRNFHQLLRADGVCRIGTWVKMTALEPLELLAHVGLDFIVVDMEHAPHTFETAYRMIVAAQGFGMASLVRLADSEGLDVQRILDAGADGVLIPRVRSADDARRMMDRMLFPPIGSRGLGVTSRAGLWGLTGTPDYVRQGNENTFRVVQLEDRDALENVEEILNVSGVNGVFVGQGDLALSSGKPASDPDNQRLISLVVEKARARGVPCGTAVGDAAAARRCKQQGFSFVMVSNDLSLFAKAADALMKSVRE